MIGTGRITDRWIDAASHENVGRMVLYRSGEWAGSNKPAVIIGQCGDVVDLAVFTYDGVVTQLGASLVEPPRGNHRAGENSCFFVET